MLVAGGGIGTPNAAIAHGVGPVGPAEAWTAWNWDPWILLVLMTMTAVYVRGVSRLWRTAGRGRGIARWSAGCYLAGIWALFVALISPVDAVGEALFSVHMIQHLLLMVVAAPLLVLGRPPLAYLWALPDSARAAFRRSWKHVSPARRIWRAASHPVVVLLLHVGALWAWHIPFLYEAALERPLVHHLEHASFFFTALLFWWALVRVGAHHKWPGYGAGILYVFATALQSGALGALMTFAPEPWYPAHEAGVTAWNLDLMFDQQVAGALMWVPMGIVYAAAVGVLLVAWLREAERSVARRERMGWERIPGVASASPADVVRETSRTHSLTAERSDGRRTGEPDSSP